MKMLDAAERKVLIVTTFVSACIAFAPMEWTSAITLLVVSGAMYFNDRRLTKRENAALAAPVTPPTPTADPPAEPAPIGAEPAPRAEPAAPPPPP